MAYTLHAFFMVVSYLKYGLTGYPAYTLQSQYLAKNIISKDFINIQVQNSLFSSSMEK